MKQSVSTVILLNIKNDVIKIEKISQGGIDGTAANPMDVFRLAVRISAPNIIVTHNHPSGDPEPSPTDIEITKQLKEAGILSVCNSWTI
jgi:DNA repair protein RadC